MFPPKRLSERAVFFLFDRVSNPHVSKGSAGSMKHERRTLPLLILNNRGTRLGHPFDRVSVADATLMVCSLAKCPTVPQQKELSTLRSPIFAFLLLPSHLEPFHRDPPNGTAGMRQTVALTPISFHFRFGVAKWNDCARAFALWARLERANCCFHWC
ncbi:hypothetical protein BH10ACI3_BH10ACI3_21010 [soil metagenome]